MSVYVIFGRVYSSFTKPLMLIDLIRKQTHTDEIIETENSSTKNPVVNNMIEYMKENIREKLKLDQIAAYVGYSIPHICALFKKTTNLSVKVYFTKLRIDRAKHLMAEQEMSIQQISEYLDFDSVQHFSLQFKKQTGLSPSQYTTYLKMKHYQHAGNSFFDLISI